MAPGDLRLHRLDVPLDADDFGVAVRVLDAQFVEPFLQDAQAVLQGIGALLGDQTHPLQLPALELQIVELLLGDVDLLEQLPLVDGDDPPFIPLVGVHFGLGLFQLGIEGVYLLGEELGGVIGFAPLGGDVPLNVEAHQRVDVVPGQAGV